MPRGSGDVTSSSRAAQQHPADGIRNSREVLSGLRSASASASASIRLDLDLELRVEGQQDSSIIAQSGFCDLVSSRDQGEML